MSDTAVEFPLNMLNKLLVCHSDLIGDTEKQIKSLQTDLRLFKAFLKVTVNQRRNDLATKLLGSNIHDVVYEVEDVIDVFVSWAMKKKATSLVSRYMKSKTGMNIHIIGRKVIGVRDEVESYWIDMGIGGKDEDGKFEAPRPSRNKDVVGFEDVRRELIQRLTGETDYFDVVSVIGMFGLGKTTLAWKIFNDEKIVYKFPIRIWLPISQKFSDKHIFLHILKQLMTVNEEIHRKDDMEIAQIVADCLRIGSFLIILDDVSNPTDWNRIRIAIPKTNKKGKILITSRDDEVGNYASNPRPPIKLRFFTQEESWELLRLEALRKLDCPPELENIGQQIARDCDGLPLSIVAIGGILATKFSASNISAMKKAWKKVSKSVSTYINEDDRADRNKNFIRKSYDDLPNHLRSCFLYFRMFPEDYEIPVSKLIRMWIGEGFIQQKLDRSLEETAHMYLEELINRNLVRKLKFRLDGEVKTCMIHDTLGEFCRIQAADENFLQEIKNVRTSNISKYRRVCVHSNCLDFISSEPFGPCVRSFVSFSKDKYDVTRVNSSNIIGAFKLLRVLDVLPFKFTKIDSGLYSLVHMRYIALSCKWSILSSKFSKLWNIQTLIVHTTSRTLEVKADIWKMKHLRHFKTNASATLRKSSASSKHGAELQTLGAISVESCTAELCDRACNLKKLGIRGQLALLFERRKGSFESLGNMEHLEKLKLVNDAYPKPLAEGRLHRLPGYDRFPSGLTSLTLCSTFLSWDHISTLGLLKKLKALKLKDHAFVGDTWQVQGGGFQSLEFLHIEHTDLAFWTASPLSYPKLTSLMLKNCEKLCGIPIELADIPTLRMLELHSCIPAAESANKILDAKQKTQAGGPEFKISMYPPIG